MDRVTYSIGLTLEDKTGKRAWAGDYDLSEPRSQGLYEGIRVQRGTPNSTVDQDIHDAIYEACLAPLRQSGEMDWRRREAGDFWSIWQWCTHSPAGAEESKHGILARYVSHLAALQSLCW
jgi:hypothetical protein